MLNSRPFVKQEMIMMTIVFVCKQSKAKKPDAHVW